MAGIKVVVVGLVYAIVPIVVMSVSVGTAVLATLSGDQAGRPQAPALSSGCSRLRGR